LHMIHNKYKYFTNIYFTNALDKEHIMYYIKNKRN